MKKFALIVFAVALVSMMFSSCRSHERCPAYGKVDVENQDKQV